MYSLGLDIAPRISFTLKSRASKIYDFLNRHSLNVKWRGLDFILLNFVLKFLTLCWQITVCTLRIATMKIVVLLIAKVRSLNLRADCHKPELSTWLIIGLRAGVG
jgi:hypothetical protein